MKKSSFRRLALLVLASVLCGVLLCEAGLRVLGFGGTMTYEPAAAWGYLMWPAQQVYVYGHPVAINAEGFRGPEVAETKGDDTARIVFVGDSVTYGGGRIREADLFVRRVETLVRETLGSAEVLNVSAPGWSPQNWIALIRSRGVYQADVVVAVIPEVDLGRPFSRLETHRLPQRAPPLRLGRFFVKLRLLMQGPDPDLWRGVDQDVEAGRNLAAVRELLVLGEEAGAAVILVLVPSLPSALDDEYWQPYERLAVPKVDIRSVFDDESLFLDGVHLSRAGHAALAAEVGPVVLEVLERRQAQKAQ